MEVLSYVKKIKYPWEVLQWSYLKGRGKILHATVLNLGYYIYI